MIKLEETEERKLREKGYAEEAERGGIKRDINDPSTWAHPPRPDSEADVVVHRGGATLKFFFAKISDEERQKVIDRGFMMQYEMLGYRQKEDKKDD